MPRASANPRSADRARVLEVLEHAEQPLTGSDISFRLRHHPYWARIRVALDALVADGTVDVRERQFRDVNSLGQEIRFRAKGYTLNPSRSP
jgi:hypothetical protein